MIFLHSSFRTSSTYVWSRFRKIEHAVAYYEIFNEVLASISHQNINQIHPGSWESGHPQSAPYFLEYLPLIKDPSGVANFDPSFSYQRFMPNSGAGGPVSKQEATYVRGLVDHAVRNGRVPVLSETRSLGRIAGLKAILPGKHVLLYRNLHQQWCSYTETYLSGNRFFIDNTFSILESNSHIQEFEYILKLFPTDDRSVSNRNTFYLFLFLHIYLYAQAADAADLIIDTNRLAVDHEYRRDIEHEFIGQNLPVDFSGAREATSFSLVDFPCKQALVEHVKLLTDALTRRWTSDKSRAFTAKIVDDFLQELERNDFYNNRARVFLKSTLREKEGALQEKEFALQQATDLCSDLDTLIADRDRLRLETDAATDAAEKAHAEAEGWRSRHETVAADRDRFTRDREDAVSAAQEAQRQAALLLRERDAAVEAAEEAERRRSELTRWSVAFHDSTAASLSWRLTRPLRWIGIGRPRRPPKPDFL